MKFIIKESQHKFLVEQSMVGWAKDLPPGAAMEVAKGWSKGNHTVNTILEIGTAFIPFIGPFLSAGIGLMDAAQYYDEGDKTSAGLTAAFSMIPFIGKIPGVKELGSRGMAALASKLISKTKLTKAESEIVNSIVHYQPHIQKELMKMAPKLTKVMKEINLYKVSYVKKFGEDEYNRLLTRFLYDSIDEPKFIQTLKTAGKTSNIKIKPILGGGQDHRIYQILSNPNQIVKVELRPGEIEKWYNTFKNNPDFFPKIFRKTKVRGQDGKLLDAVILEKLNTKPFMDLWDKLESILHKSQTSLPYNQQTSNLEYLLKKLKIYPNLNKKWDYLIKTIKSGSPELSGKVDEFVKIVDELYKITPNPDIRKFNLGYDTNGVLKVLDL